MVFSNSAGGTVLLDLTRVGMWDWVSARMASLDLGLTSELILRQYMAEARPEPYENRTTLLPAISASFWLCVRESERERVRVRESERAREREREQERERERERESKRESKRERE